MGNKLVKDIDDRTWRMFVGFCKMKNVKVGEGLETAINEYLKKRLKEVMKP